MSTYLIGYDLNKPHKDYPDLIEAIKSLSKTWWHHLDSTWIINHPGSASDIRNALKIHIDGNDEILVAELSGEAAWAGFSPKGSAWLKDQL